MNVYRGIIVTPITCCWCHRKIEGRCPGPALCKPHKFDYPSEHWEDEDDEDDSQLTNADDRIKITVTAGTVPIDG